MTEKLWFWLSQFFEEHPDFASDWACRCVTCCQYAAEDFDDFV